MVSNTLSFTQSINTQPNQIYRAFTRSTAFRQWLCDTAQADARPGGRLYLWWSGNYYACGEYISLERHKSVSFTWFGKGEPGQTNVLVTISPTNIGSLLKLEHSLIGTGERWEATIKEIKKGWDISLKNLASVLETGKDQRFTRQPMLGISIGEYNANIAKTLDIPSSHGVRIEEVNSDMGAQAAGLKPNDVIESIEGTPVEGWQDLSKVLQAFQAGDQVEIKFFRGDKKHTSVMKLSPRQLPNLPPTAETLAETIQGKYKTSFERINKLVEGILDDQASNQPTPGEWSIKEIIAHLIITEREWQSWIADLINDDERLSDDFTNPTNVLARISAILSIHPSLPSLLKALKLSQTETLTMLAAVPLDLVERKGSFFQLTYTMVESESHIQSHIDQIQRAVELTNR